jgi:hypothetical protein
MGLFNNADYEARLQKVENALLALAEATNQNLDAQQKKIDILKQIVFTVKDQNADLQRLIIEQFQGHIDMMKGMQGLSKVVMDQLPKDPTEPK